MTDRLTAYPTGLAGAPNVHSVSFTASPGGPTLPELDLPDADPIGSIDVLTASPSAATVASLAPVRGPSAVAAGTRLVAGHVVRRVGHVHRPSGESSIPEVLRSAPATPPIALIGFLTAGVLGAGHALTPGHGKTLMAVAGRQGVASTEDARGKKPDQGDQRRRRRAPQDLRDRALAARDGGGG